LILCEEIADFMQQSHALIYLPIPTKQFAKYQKNNEENDEDYNQGPQDVASYIIHRISSPEFLVSADGDKHNPQNDHADDNR